MPVRAAVIIGVDRTGRDLPLLAGAAADAERIEAWLRDEGYRTSLLTDTSNGVRGAGRVSIADVAAAIAAFLQPMAVEQLVVYFAGHGLNNFNTEIWLLSGAPAASNEAINLTRNIELARDCKVSNVVFVSDACRSNPTAGPLRRVEGSAVFPNLAIAAGPRGKVDRLLPTAPNSAAYETNETLEDVVGRAGIFTTELLAAHGYPSNALPRTPDAETSLVRIDRSTGDDVRVIDLSLLAEHLQARVPLAAEEKSIEWPQQPECIVETPPRDKFLGRARFARRDTELAAAVAVDRSSLPESAARMREGLERGLAATRSAIEQADQTRHFETHTGVRVTGDSVVWAGGLGLSTEEPENIPAEGAYLIGIKPDKPAGTVVLQFGSGNGAAIASFRGYIAAVKVVGGAVANVSYVPSDGHERWNQDPDKWRELGALRADVAARVRYGDFNLRSDEARGFADRIRVQRSVDPTLGLYAAYAYNDAGDRDEIRSVEDVMRGDLFGYAPFDVVMLGHTPIENLEVLQNAVPFCPMLMQGWPHLRNRLAQLPALLDALLSQHLMPALWTTFDPEGAQLLRSIAETRPSP